MSSAQWNALSGFIYLANYFYWMFRFIFLCHFAWNFRWCFHLRRWQAMASVRDILLYAFSVYGKKKKKKGKLCVLFLFTSSPPFGCKVTLPFDAVGVVFTTGVLSSFTFAFMLKVLTSSSSSWCLLLFFWFCTLCICYFRCLVAYCCGSTIFASRWILFNFYALCQWVIIEWLRVIAFTFFVVVFFLSSTVFRWSAVEKMNANIPIKIIIIIRRKRRKIHSKCELMRRCWK